VIRAVASLGMYDHPAQQRANDLLWAAIARALREDGVDGVPDALDRTRDVHALWRDPGLLFGQACGYPLVSEPDLDLRLLALPVYVVAGRGGPTHRSVIVCRGDDPRGSLAAFHRSCAAVNDPRSNTGMNLLRATIARDALPAPFFDTIVRTGSHRESVNAVATARADIAAIDEVTYAALARFEPDLVARLRIIASSPDSPTLPFVTAATTSDDMVRKLRTALGRAIADPALADVRATLFLTGVVPADADALTAIVALETAAVGAGHAALA